MKKKSRDRRVAMRAQRRNDKLFGMLKFNNGSSILIAHPTMEEIRGLANAFTAPLNESEDAFNKQMEAIGVPSFSDWFARKGQDIIDKAAMAGKPGAFILQQMIGAQDDPIQESE